MLNLFLQRVSDKAIKCPGCGKTLRKNKHIKNNKYNIILDQKTIYTIDKKRKFKRNVLKFICITIFIIIVLFITLVFLNIDLKTIIKHELTIKEMDINKWKLLEEGSYLDYYEGTLISNEKKPFMAIIGYYDKEENDIPIKDFVFMNDGKGIFQIGELSDEDPSIKYKPIGYFKGKVLKESDIMNIKSNVKDYEDWSETTECSIDIEFETKNKKSGLLFVELENDLTNNIDKNIPIIIVNGKGKYTYNLTDLPLKSRGVEISIIPKYFCACNKMLEENDYIIESYFKAEKNDYGDYYGSEEISFNNYNDGLIIYTTKLLEGGKKELRGEEYSISFLTNNECTISTYTPNDDEDKRIVTPVYDIQIVGYLTWNEYNE